MTSPLDPVHSARSVRPPVRQFLMLFLPVALLILAAGFSFVGLRTEDQLSALVKDERTQLYHVGGFIGAEISGALDHVRALTDELVVRQAVESPNSATLHELQSNLLTLARRNPNYQQVRWIDDTGKERVRITRDKGQLHAVAEADLQDKSDRYYFTASRALPGGGLYVSRVDLNVEHGQIEMPPRAVVRVASPVEAGTGQRRGILIVNISVKYMLEAVRRMRRAANDTDYLLVNQEGYRLVTGDRDWGFDSGSESDLNFAILQPAVWKQIKQRSSGSAELSSGLWIWDTLSSADMIGASGLALANARTNSLRLNADELSLTLIAYKPVATLMQMRRDVRMPVILGAMLVLGVYGLSLVFFLRSQMVERRSELNATYARTQAANMKRLKELEERFRRLVETSSVGQIVVNVEGRIVMSNPAAESMLGFTKGDLDHRPVDELLAPELQQRHAQLRESFLQAPEPRKMGEGRELEAVTKDGRRIRVEVGLNPYVDNGEQFVLASIIDVTERQRDATTT